MGKLETKIQPKRRLRRGEKRVDDVRELTFLERCFVRRYVATRDPVKAALAAGFRAEDCDLRVEGKRMLETSLIAGAIELEQRALLAQYRVDEESIIAELAKLAFSNLSDYVTVADEDTPNKVLVADLVDVPHEKMAAIQEYTVDERTSEKFDREGNLISSVTTRKPRIKLSDKRAALMDLARLKGLLKEDEDGNDTLTINVIGGLPDRDTRDVLEPGGGA